MGRRVRHAALSRPCVISTALESLSCPNLDLVTSLFSEILHTANHVEIHDALLPFQSSMHYPHPDLMPGSEMQPYDDQAKSASTIKANVALALLSKE